MMCDDWSKVTRLYISLAKDGGGFVRGAIFYDSGKIREAFRLLQHWQLRHFPFSGFRFR